MREESRYWGTSQVATILGAEAWRVKNFAAEAYGLPPSLLVGAGKRKTRLYSVPDVLRLAVANELERCGFDPPAIGQAVREIPESLLLEWSGRFVEATAAASKGGRPKADSLPMLCSVAGEWHVLKAREARATVEKALEFDGDSRAVVVLNLTALFADTIRRTTELESEGRI